MFLSEFYLIDLNRNGDIEPSGPNRREATYLMDWSKALCLSVLAYPEQNNPVRNFHPEFLNIKHFL